MTPTPSDRRWRLTVLRQARRIAAARRERGGLLEQSMYLGTLGFVFVVPVVIATYAGLWIDQHLPGYSVRGTVSGLIFGLTIGVVDVWLMLREPD